MDSPRDVEFVFEPQTEGGYHAYAPEMPGEDGRPLEMGIVRRGLPLPA